VKISAPRCVVVVVALNTCAGVYAQRLGPSDHAGHKATDLARHQQTRLDETGATKPHLDALRTFAASLDTDGDVERAAKCYTDVMTHARGPRVLAHVFIETRDREFPAGQPATFSVRVPFRPIQSERYEWKFLVLQILADGSNHTIISTGGGETVRKSVWSLEICGPSEASGDYELLFVLFGRTLPEGKFDFLDSVRIPYTVRPMMAK
jgi:hypothetical protein